MIGAFLLTQSVHLVHKSFLLTEHAYLHPLSTPIERGLFWGSKIVAGPFSGSLVLQMGPVDPPGGGGVLVVFFYDLSLIINHQRNFGFSIYYMHMCQYRHRPARFFLLGRCAARRYATLECYFSVF